MHSRLRLAALALRLSYNLLFLDTDVILFDDPYRILKAIGPGFNLLAPGNIREVNLGVMYVQDVKPSGPVAWIFAEAVDRILRWAENETWVHHSIGAGGGFLIKNFQHMMWDQMSFGDSLMSAAISLNRPMFFNAFMFQEPRSGGETIPFDKAHMAWRMSYSNWTSRIINRDVEIPSLPDPLRRMAESELGAGSSITVPAVDLGWVFSRGVWPQELGGPAFPPGRGVFSKGWRDLLMNVTSHPLWPDPEDLSCFPQDPNTPDVLPKRCQWQGKETVGFLPKWCQSQYTGRLPTQSYTCQGNETAEPTQVFGHLLFLS